MNSNHRSDSAPLAEQFERFRNEVTDTIDQVITETLAILPQEQAAGGGSSDAYVAQLKAILAARICDIQQEIMLRQANGDRLTLTVVSRQNYSGYLAQLIRRLPDEGNLLSAKIFSSADKQFVVDIFEFGSQSSPKTVRELSADETLIAKRVAEWVQADLLSVQTFLASYQPGSELFEAPEEIARQFMVLEKRKHPNDLNVIWETTTPQKQEQTQAAEKLFARVTVSSGNVTTREVFTRAAEFFGQYQIDIERAFCETVWLDEHDQVALLTFHVAIEQSAFTKARERVGGVCSEVLDGDVLRSRLISFLRVDEEVVVERPRLKQSLATTWGDLGKAELFCAFSRLIHQVFQLDVSRERIIDRLLAHPKTTTRLLERYIGRFDHTSPLPPEDDSNVKFESIEDSADREIFRYFLALVDGIDRCNLNLVNRRALAIRVPGQLLTKLGEAERPYCVFYVYGAGFDGFHVRFRDVSRGGMRIVKTRNHEHYLHESSRAFDEVLKLAFAQQLKNKDIAEGGSKALIVLRPNISANRGGHDFFDGILDLLVEGRKVTPVGGHPVSDEYLYFGPDENVTNRLIEWFVKRAEQRGYPFPNSIMSSKPSTGINHKEYGVTSEGVVVFLHQALIENEYDPEGSFSVKLTGGPDGDVGGNAIRILIRDFGERVKIVAVADGTGTASDPDGLHHGELLRLVREEVGIACFAKEQLGPQGEVTRLNSDSEIARRNNLHFQVESDVFIPAGGRPATINGNNWHKFLGEDQHPKSKIIVEGANLFITDQARSELSQHGVVIVKDSSANKCGVICSSLEIILAMLLDEKEIGEIRPRFIAETIELLQLLARHEAVAIFNEHARFPQKTLPEISVLVSEEILRVADEIMSDYETWDNEQVELAHKYIVSFLPQSLIEKLGTGVAKKIPPVYRKQLVASIISSRVVYREGWQNLSNLHGAKLIRLIKREMAYENDVQRAINELKISDITEKQRIIAVLEHSGVRSHRELNL